MKQSKIKLILGALLLPFVFLTFLADRFLLIFLFWIDAPSLSNWMAKETLWAMSITRIIIFGILSSVFFFIQWLF